METFKLCTYKKFKTTVHQTGLTKEAAVEAINNWWNQLDHNGDFDEEPPKWGIDGELYGYCRDKEIVCAEIETE